MVNRTHFKCRSCSVVVACRTQFGHGREQTYLFACPNCGVDLGYTLFIDQAKLGWMYGEFVNLEESNCADTPPHVLNFSSDFLVLKQNIDSKESTPWTPQMQNLNLVKDMEGYFSLRNLRRGVANKLWPALDRANVHRVRNDFDKFQSELKSINADQFLDSFQSRDMSKIMVEGFEKFEEFFSYSNRKDRRLVEERLLAASTKDAKGVAELKKFYAEEDRADHLFNQLRVLDKQWVELYSFFEPLEIIDCLKDHGVPLSARFTLSEKPIERLKSFHSDCFETLGRIFVLAACYEGIIAGVGVGVPSRKRLIPPQEYELVSNGSKPDLISGMPFWPIFSGVFDPKLRNGIGHHSWRFEASTDTIHYQNHSPSRGRECFSVSYLDFCIQTRKLYHAVTIAAKYVHSVWGG